MAVLKQDELGDLVATVAIGRTTEETIKTILNDHADILQRLWGDVVRNAILNKLQNTKKRRAKLIVGQTDLFAKYDLPAIVSDNNARTRNEKIAGSLSQMTKSWLKDKIDSLRRKPSKKEIELSELSKLLVEIDEYCGDDESIETGLRRANGKG